MPKGTQYTLQEWDWTANRWATTAEYDAATDSRAEGNAVFAYDLQSSMRPTRLLLDGTTILGSDDPEDHYRD